MGNSYGYDLSVLVRLGTLRICAPSNRLTLAFGACWSRMHGTKAWASQDIASHHDRIPRNMRIADSDTCSSHDSFGTYRRKCTGAPYVRLQCCMAFGTNAVRTRVRVARVSRRDAYRAVFRAVLVSCHMRIRTTVITNHAFDLNFPSLCFSYCSGRYRPR